MTPSPKLEVIFFKTLSGSEPVKEWLKNCRQLIKKLSVATSVHYKLLGL